MNVHEKPLSRGPCALATRSRGILGRGGARDRLDRAGEQDFRLQPGLYGRWFTGAVVNTCYNALDRHVASGRADQPALIYDSPLTGTHQHIHLRAVAARGETLAGMHAGLRRRQRRPRHPLHADGAGSGGGDAGLRADRRGAFGGVRRLRRQGTRDPDRRRQAQADPVRQLRHRARPHRAVQAADRRGHQAGQRQAAGLHRPAAPAAGLRSRERPRPRLGRVARTRVDSRQDAPLRPGAGDRSALHPLHLGHDRHAQGRGARQWRPSGRAEMVDVQPLRHQARRGLVVRLGYRLGRRPQLHRLRPADPWRDLDHV